MKGVKMLEKIAKLIDVKTIVTFALVGTMVYLGVKDKIDSEKVYLMAMVILTYYFTKKDTSS